MIEFISRDAAIKAAFSLCRNTDYPFIDEIQNAIEEIPAADVRPVNKTDIDGNELFRRIAGHSYYKGDDILTRISLMQEGKSQKEDIKPADVRPVVHGEWRGEYDECSICGGSMSELTDAWRYYGVRFCPWCGADMRKVHNNE